jgi:prepilin-type N-terminal cleavage/methylation domain-containing protein
MSSIRTTGICVIPSNGFTLTELAIVLVIVAVLLGGLLGPLSVQYENANVAATQKTLSEIREALIGFAIAKGRLPCPASPGAMGVENPGGGACANPYSGFVPAITLGLPNQDANGYILDAWGNRIRYAVTTQNGSAFTTFTLLPPAGMKATTIGLLTPDLHVCTSATGVTATTCGATAITLTADAPAVIFSTGKDGNASAGLDEGTNNGGVTPVFVSHEPTPSPNQFTHIVTWLPTSILLNRMVAAGQLP